MRDLTMSFPVVTDDTFPHGLRCTTCHREIQAGQPYGSSIPVLLGDDEVSVLVCVYCG